MALLCVALLSTSCIKESRYLTDTSARLAFSEDTVTFDTVFATMGTVTKQVKVYNNYDEPLLLNYVTLREGALSRFRINVDGDTSLVARDVEIGAHDSIFIFIQAVINPNDQLTPYLVEDAIVFGFNNKEQKLPLTAYGRNAVYHMPKYRLYSTYTDSHGNIDTIWYPFSIIDCANWDHTRPHVIMGYAVVNSNETLHLTAGDELYFGNDSYLWIYDSASLDVQGTRERPVLFTSIRHDGHYDSLPGQWGYVWLSAGSKDSRIDWAVMENGLAGLLVDTNVNANPTLVISNSVIINHSYSGIIGQGAYITGDNLLVANCGITLLSLQYGGRYRFSNSTFANYWSHNARSAPAVVLNNHYDIRQNNSITTYPRDLQQADFFNCIIYGNYTGRDSTGELLLDYLPGASFNCGFHYCLIRTFSIDSGDYGDSHLLINRDPLFVNPRHGDFHLQEGSPAIGSGNAAYLIRNTDLDGNPRKTPPSIGAYEAE